MGVVDSGGMNDAAIGAAAIYVILGIGGFFLAVLITRWAFRIDRIVELLEQSVAAHRHVQAPTSAPPGGPREAEITESNLDEVVARLNRNRGG